MLEEIRAGLLTGGSLRLFKSNHTPVQGDNAATYTAIEATFGGYAPITTNSWGAVFTNTSNEAETDETLRTFLATGAGLPETIFGVFLLSSAGALLYAELDPAGGTVLSAAGQAFSYLPKFTLKTQ